MPNLNLFNEILLICIVLGVIFIIISDNITKNIIALSMLGIFISLDFILLKAKLVAMPEAIIAGVFIPIILIITLKKTNSDFKDEADKKNFEIYQNDFKNQDKPIKDNYVKNSKRKEGNN